MKTKNVVEQEYVAGLNFGDTLPRGKCRKMMDVYYTPSKLSFLDTKPLDFFRKYHPDLNKSLEKSMYVPAALMTMDFSKLEERLAAHALIPSLQRNIDCIKPELIKEEIKNV